MLTANSELLEDFVHYCETHAQNGIMLCWITIVGGALIMMGQHSRSEALFYYFRLDRAH